MRAGAWAGPVNFGQEVCQSREREGGGEGRSGWSRRMPNCLFNLLRSQSVGSLPGNERMYKPKIIHIFPY